MTIIPLHTDIMELLGGKGLAEIDLETLYDQGGTNLCHSFGTMRGLRQIFITQVLAINVS